MRLKDSLGWRHLQQVINDRCKDSEALWLGCASSDPYVLFGVQRTYRATLAFRNQLYDELNWAEQRLKEYADDREKGLAVGESDDRT